MKVIYRFIDWFLYTSLLTASCAVALCMATERLTTAGNPGILSRFHMLVFGSSLVVYNMPRLVRKPYGRARSAQPYRSWYIFFLCAGLLLTAWGLYQMPVYLLVLCGILGLFAFAYFLPILPFGVKRRLRDFGWIKISVLASVWTVATSILPILYQGKAVSAYPYEVLLRFAFIFTLCVLFDIRDMRIDRQNNITTLPNKVGLQNSYLLIAGTLILFVLLSAEQFVHYHEPERLVSALLTAAATGSVTIYLSKHPSDRAYMGLADGMMLLYAVLVLAL